ncbi:hypothetical protein JYU34_006523 [Plutella xylostella]|uniref:Peptidoglycan-recognition protein n=1 Tax=Plutella xylostella TaxID=51655 RepID=A0ABQ7QS80_PLUXY|nr:hypothetical protein JYU34_006523 [Plutella xylostella]
MSTFMGVFLLCSLLFFSSAYADCDVLTRSEWGGVNATQEEDLPRPIDLVIIQHTATDTCNTDEECQEYVQWIQIYHMQSLNYWDIGPNFLIGGNGKVYEGPGWLHMGAHTHGYNRKSVGISFIGNFNDIIPTNASLLAAEKLIECGVTEEHLSPSYSLVGHRQLRPTESPGKNLYEIIQKWPHYLENVDDIINN